MKNTLLQILLFILFGLSLVSCGSVGEIDTSDEVLSKVADSMQPVINALEKYKNDNGNYPNDIMDTSPKYLRGIEKYAHKWKFNNIAFMYIRSDQAVALSDEEKQSWGGYELKVSDIKQVAILGDRSNIIFEYRPSHFYPKRKYQIPKRRIKNWALVEHFRTYGAEGL